MHICTKAFYRIKNGNHREMWIRGQYFVKNNEICTNIGWGGKLKWHTEDDISMEKDRLQQTCSQQKGCYYTE